MSTVVVRREPIQSALFLAFAALGLGLTVATGLGLGNFADDRWVAPLCALGAVWLLAGATRSRMEIVATDVHVTWVVKQRVIPMREIVRVESPRMGPASLVLADGSAVRLPFRLGSAQERAVAESLPVPFVGWSLDTSE
jgi:hypothetical protein